MVAFAQELATQRRSRHTIKNYALALDALRRWLEDERGQPGLRLAEADAQDLKQYQIHLVAERGLSKNTLYFKIKAIQAFYRFLELEVAEGLKPPRRSQSLPKYLTESEARTLIENAQTPQDHTIITLLLYSGLRVSELLGLETHDIDFLERTVRVRSGKGDKDRLVVVAPKVMDLLKGWLQVRPPARTDHLFPGRGGRAPLSSVSVQRMVARTARQAGLEKHVTPHVLRHTLATTLLRKGGDIRFIQRMLGHASIATTQIYTHLDDAEMRRMYDQAAPEY